MSDPRTSAEHTLPLLGNAGEVAPDSARQSLATANAATDASVKHVVSAGLVTLGERTFEYDLAISERYQAFSAELLRLALLGIGGIGFLLLKLDPGTTDHPSLIRQNLASIQPFLHVALVSFGLCCTAAVAHRFASADGLAYHLKLLRLLRDGYAESHEKVLKEHRGRRQRWGSATWLLVIASVALAAGVGTLAWAFVKALELLA
jgi:hypothetical protein